MNLKTAEYIIDDIRIRVSDGRVFASIHLESYEVDRMSKLINMLTLLKDAGFTKYDTSYENGYYDSVENISLTFMEDSNKIKMDILKPEVKR